MWSMPCVARYSFNARAHSSGIQSVPAEKVVLPGWYALSTGNPLASIVAFPAAAAVERPNECPARTSLAPAFWLSEFDVSFICAKEPFRETLMTVKPRQSTSCRW